MAAAEQTRTPPNPIAIDPGYTRNRIKQTLPSFVIRNMNRKPAHLVSLLCMLLLACAVHARTPAVGITAKLAEVHFSLDGKTYTIKRDQNSKATIDPAYARTSRPCPPFCIQPIKLAPGVETLGELELIDYLQRMAAGENILVIDSRTADWANRGTVPGARNIPWTRLSEGRGANPLDISDLLVETFGAVELDEGWDFGKAKTLVLFCNGMWCGQSPTNIRSLLRLGYPADKIKWYRDGMQGWKILGFNSEKPR